MQWSNDCLSRYAAKVAKVCCDRLLLALSANFVIVTVTATDLFIL